MVKQNSLLLGFEMILELGVSIRIFPLLDLHIREEDCALALPPGASDLVAQSEHEGGMGG